MFSKKITDVKKSTLKIQDAKKDLATRVKHLKIILDNVDHAEAKGLFEANFSHIFQILYDTFILAEGNLRQRELSFHLVHKAHKEELEGALWILEQVLSLLPELIHKRWQIHSLGRILSKLLHPGNTAKLRQQAIKYFLMWYQALNENAPDKVHHMFASIVPGFVSKSAFPSQMSGSVFHDSSAQNPVSPIELLPILPATNTDNMNKSYLDILLENMANTVVRLEWHDKTSHHHRCFHFLLERFKIHYLPKLCPTFCLETSLYRPNLELPMVRKPETETKFVTCRVILIKWITHYTHQMKKPENNPNPPSTPASQASNINDDESHDSSHPSLDSNMSLQTIKAPSDEELASQIVRDVLWSSRDNVNFIHELYRQAFLLNFNYPLAIRKTIVMYKDLIQNNVPETPPYMLEPMEEAPNNRHSEVEGVAGFRPVRLRNDSYLGAIQKENLLVRAGLQNVLQLFMTHAANVFLLEVNSDFPKLLEEQTDTCKRVLNIYRYMVMHTRMDNATWEQLLVVLLQITSLVIGESQPKVKNPSLGRKLAPAIFQTLIVTWIKANLNVMISRELWDRFLVVLTSLTHWEELIKEWAKTMETLTRVLARHVYNLDLTDLPLDRLSEQKSKKTRRGIGKIEISSVGSSGDGGTHQVVTRQDSNVPDGMIIAKFSKPGLARSYSETNLTKRRSSTRSQQRHPRRSHSLDNLRQQDNESTDRTRSPSPAPSSGLESTSIKDTPIQLDVLASENSCNDGGGENRGVVCGGSVRGWLPDVAVILWRRMLGALGNVNNIGDPNLHAQVFEYLVKLNETLIKIRMNQGISIDNQSTPISPELVPPLTLILPWCFGALNLSQNYEAGKINALRLVCTITVHCNPQHRNYLPLFYRSLHIAFYGTSRAALNVALRHLGPRFLSLQLSGSSILSFDLLHACNSVLNSTDLSQATPRTEAVSILGGLLSTPQSASMSVFQPELPIRLMPYPDKLKDHIVEILLRAGKREPTGVARCNAITALGHFVYRELMNQTFHASVVEAVNVILWCLKFKHNTIAKLASNTLFLLCDHAEILWNQYPRLADSVIRSLCGTLFLHLPGNKSPSDCDKALSTSLLLCLGEWCMRLGSNRLIRVSEYGDNRGTSLLLLVFKVLHALIKGETSGFSVGSGQIPDDFEASLFLDNFDGVNRVQNTSVSQCRDAVVLCARTVLAHLVTHLGHFPMAIGAARLSSLVVEHDDVPHLTSDELSMDIFNSPNIQLFVLTPSVIASLVELPALDLPGGGITAGLSTADRQVRVLLRDLSGKVSWDTSILYRTPEICSGRDQDEDCKDSIVSSGSKWGPMSMIQSESLMMPYPFSNLQQRAMRHRSPNVLPSVDNAAPDLDQLDDLLQYLGHTSPECLESADRKLNEAAPSPISRECEAEAITSVISQRNLEVDAIRYAQSNDVMFEQPASRPSSRISGSISSSDLNINQQGLVDSVEQNAFQQCRLLFSQLGLAGWERRKQLHLLKKNERLLRELRNLDNQRCRETHKVAVIYVAPGQEDKNSILSNQGGSVAYEQFLAALAWEVELEGHTGFLGGLQRQGSTGLTAPYFATSFFEVIFHVATRMPGDTPEAVLSKTRHLGNDEVHIVWSEHGRDYRRDIIPTEFCDILITIYPLGNNLNRVTVNCKPEVPYFGILFDEAIIENKILAGVIRTAVICASRAKRSTLPYYQQYYEERSRSLETVVTKHRDATTYEDFIARVYSPVMSLNSMSYGVSASGGSGDASCSSNNTSSLAAALLDSGQSLKSSQREHKFKDSRVWFNHSDNVESTSISPRPLKKLQTTLKNVPRRSLKQDQHHSSENPPESPTQFIRKK